MQRWDIINFFIEKNNYNRYLEIGYYKGWSFDRIGCPFKTAVDPNPSKTPDQEEALMNSNILIGAQGIPRNGDLNDIEIQARHLICKNTSDNFFKNLRDSEKLGAGHNEWDIIFIDGLHEREQVLRDLRNAFNHLSKDGIIIMHDCNPEEYLHTTTGINGFWTGDVYKAMLDLRNSPEADAYVIDTDFGVGIVRPVPYLKLRDITATEHFNGLTSWEYFNENRKHLLDLVDISTFLKREREKEMTVKIL